MAHVGLGRLFEMPLSRRDTLKAAAALGVSGGLAASGIRLTAAQDADYPELTLVATEYHFDMPATAESGFTRLTLDNQGGDDHHAIFFRVNDDATPDAFQQALMSGDLGAIMAVGTSYGGPMAGPGMQASVVVNLDPGMYMVVCVIPDAQGIPHAAHGMVAQLEVTEGTSTATAPEVSGTISLVEMSFSGLPTEVPAGSAVWEVTNNGAQLHEMFVGRLADGVTFDMLMGMLMSEGGGATPEAAAPAMASPVVQGPPYTGVGGVAPMSPGMTNYAELELEAGEHFAICFVPDMETGVPHAMMGMVAPFTVS
jgi:hypothetical protein